MAEYLGAVYLGGLYKSGTAIIRPTLPFWSGDDGNITIKDDALGKYVIGNTPSNEAYKIRWHKIKDGSKTLLICDRNILGGVSWDELNTQSYVFGRDIVIDGRKYKCRLLTGGTYMRSTNTSTRHDGADPPNEWDKYIGIDGNIPGIPIPSSTDRDTKKNTTDLNGAHNKFWNWYAQGSWCQDSYRINSSSKVMRGRGAAPSIDGVVSYADSAWYGWRPVLEILNNPPTVSGADTNMGAKNTNFNITYSVNDVDISDILTVTEKLDNGTIRTISSAVRNQTYTINITPANLALGGHTVIITVNDGKGGTAQRTYTFQRSNSAPVISGTDTNHGQMTGAFSRSYTITDADGDKVTVTEKLDTEILRTYTASLGVAQNISVSQDRWIRMRNGNHTLKVEASDGKASTVIRTFNFSKNERIISFTLSTPFEADVRPRKILVTPSWQIEGATAKVEVCNNAFDSAPTWEDMTPQVIINRVFNFINQNKTAGKWGVNIRITITKNEGYAGEVSISSIGGAFE